MSSRLYCLYNLCLLAGLLLLHGNAPAQDNPVITSYSVNEGLPQSSVWDIAQDKHGFLWVSTSDGLCRFDGYTFHVYKHDPRNPYSINSAKDNHFFVDSDQQLWISSARGISLYDSERDRFINIFTYDANSPELTTKNAIYGESAGYIWAALNRYGFIRIDKKNRQFQQVKVPGAGQLSGFQNWTKGFIGNGNIYGNNNQGFFRYNIAANQFSQLAGTENTLVACNLNDKEVLTCSRNTVFLVDKATLQVRSFSIALTGAPNLVFDIHKISDKEVILGTAQGLHYLDLATGKITRETASLEPGRSPSYVQCFFNDRSGNLWIGTNGDGLRKIAGRFKKFDLYRPGHEKGSMVKSIYADSAGLYAGYYETGIDMFPKNGGPVRHTDVSTFRKGLANSVFSILPLGRSRLLLYVFGEFSNTVYSYDMQTEGATDLAPFIKKAVPYDLPGEPTFSFARAAKGGLIGACDEYLFSIQERSGSFVIDSIAYLEDERVSCIFDQGDKGTWAGTFNGLYHILNNNITRINLDKKLLVKTIETDTAGHIWAGTVDGIYVLDDKGRVLQHYTEANGLLNHFIYGILRDNRGDMWFSTNKGLGRYRWREKQFDFYTADDGLQSNEFNTGAYYKAADGRLFFGGINGTTAFYPEAITRNSHAPPVNITSIKLFDEPYRTSQAYWDIRSLVLPYTDNTLSFEFSLPEYTHTGKNRYAYMLDGVDSKWIPAGDKRFARYAALQPGKYIFKVKAANNDGVWGKEQTISIHIVPPFWQRTWFIVLMAVAAIALITGIVLMIQKQRFRKKLRAIEMQQKVQHERERISRDLHDNVGTQLSLINKSIEGIIHPYAPATTEDKERNLVTISQTSKEVIATLRETIWALNKEAIPLEEFSDKLKNYARKQVEIFSGLQLHYTAILEQDETILNSSEAIHLFRICQEAIANSLKYAAARHLDVSVSAENGKYRIVITDDGVGFDQTLVNPVINYGIENMKYRAREIGCDFMLESISGRTTLNITKK
ncbi:MAG: two-component regulator propeller domain-containing protein [Chitinophagaceae bacterium]